MYEEKKEVSRPKTLTIKIPKLSVPSVQTLILVLLIAVGSLQTVQLFGLKEAVASSRVKPAAASTTTSPSGGGGSQLPSMVGGC